MGQMAEVKMEVVERSDHSVGVDLAGKLLEGAVSES